MPAPYAEDSSTTGPLVSTKVSYTLSTSGSTTLLNVNVDPTWLANAVYPVYVDPSVVTISGQASMTDTFVDTTSPDHNYSNWVDTTAGPVHAVALGMNPVYNSEVCTGLLYFTNKSKLAWFE